MEDLIKQLEDMIKHLTYFCYLIEFIKKKKGYINYLVRQIFIYYNRDIPQELMIAIAENNIEAIKKAIAKYIEELKQEIAAKKKKPTAQQMENNKKGKPKTGGRH